MSKEQILGAILRSGWLLERAVDGVSQVFIFRPRGGGGACVTPVFNSRALRRMRARVYRSPGQLGVCFS